MILRFEPPFDEGLSGWAYRMEVQLPEYVRDIDSAKNTIRIFSGECYPAFYLDNVVEAFKRAKDRGVSTSIICSPIILTLVADHNRYSGVLDMLEKGYISLYRRKCRGREQHYRIIDGRFARVEDFHGPLEPAWRRISRMQTDVRPLMEEFDQYLDREDTIRIKDPLDELIILSPTEFESIRDNCIDRYHRRNFLTLSGEEILSVFNELRLFWWRESNHAKSDYRKIKAYLDEKFVLKTPGGN